MQNQRDRDEFVDCSNQLIVQNCLASCHRVRRTHSNSKQINAGICDKLGRIFRIGTCRRVVDTVLSANFTQFGLDADAVLVSESGDLSGSLTVLRIWKL